MPHLQRWFYVLFILAIFKTNVNSQTSSRIPRILQRCYQRNFTSTGKPPLTLPLLLELIGKAERNNGNTVSLRILASSIFHGVVFNGVRRNRNVSPDLDGVIPYAATGQEFNRYRVLIDYLIPGKLQLFPADALTLPELCFLHRLVSSTVDEFERGDEINTCRSQTFMPLIEGSSSDQSSCPLKQGIISTKWGPISIHHVIAGISTGLEPNQVTFDGIANFMESDLLVNRSTLTQNQEVNPIWVAVLAADIAHAILNQTIGHPVIGNEGYWNDTLYPRAFYLDSQTWDMIEADILAGIDGLILGTYVRSWLSYLDSTRLSQILDMYYSRRGIPYDQTFKAANRTTGFKALLKSANLEQQVIGSAKLLRASGPYSMELNDEAIKLFSQSASEKFVDVASKIASKYDRIEFVNGKELKSSLELIVILDGSYDYYKALQMIYALSDGIQVSYYGSSIGIINGQTGNWISNVTRERFQLFTDVTETQENWPVTLSSLWRSLHAALWHYQNKTHIDCSLGKIKPVTQVIMVFSRDGRLTNNDLRESKLSLNTIKASYPGTRVIYVTSRENSGLKQLIQDEDDAIINFSTDVLSLATQVVDRLADLPANVVKFYCNNSQVVFEDYITPQSGKLYEIHKEYVRRGYFYTKFRNSDYGDLSVCAFNSVTPNNKNCTNLSTNGDVSFSSTDFCSINSPCSLQFAVNASASKIKCAESDCRYPDQVRLEIHYTYTSNGYLFLSHIFLISLANILVISY